MDFDFCFDKIENIIYDYDRQLKTVSKYRFDRICSYRQSEDKLLALGATLLLGGLLEKHGLNEAEMVYASSEHGKPYFKNSSLKFSLSHSGKYCAAALSGKEVGIDIQQIKDINLKIGERFFTKEEYGRIKSADDFFRIWTLKESFVKATGKGLSTPLSSFCVKNPESKPFVDYDGKKYRFTEKSVEDYKIAICTEE